MGLNQLEKLLKLLESRRGFAEGKEAMDWGMAELLAYGSLLHEGTSVRLSGQALQRQLEMFGRQTPKSGSGITLQTADDQRGQSRGDGVGLGCRR